MLSGHGHYREYCHCPRDGGASGGQTPVARRRHKNKPLPRLRTQLGVARRFNVIANRIAADLNRLLTLVERELTRQAAACLCRCEQLQAQLLSGEIVVADELVRLTSEARRITATLRRVRAPDIPSDEASFAPLRDRLAAGDIT